jgi:hypothetical protein
VIHIYRGRRDIGFFGNLGHGAGDKSDFIDQLNRGLKQGGLFFIILGSHGSKINDHSFLSSVFFNNYSISPFPDGREKIQSRQCGKRNSKPQLINLYVSGVLGLNHSLEEG